MPKIFMNAHTVMAMLNDAGFAVGTAHYQEPVDKYLAGIEGLINRLEVADTSEVATNHVPANQTSGLQIS
jgi:hypothetical protein